MVSFEISVETPNVLSEVNRGFRQFLQANDRTVLHTGPRLNPFQFTFHYHPSYGIPLVPYRLHRLCPFGRHTN